MKLHLPAGLRKALLVTFAALSATLGSVTVYAAGLHSQVSIQTYTDFGQNMGMYRVVGVNPLLQAIRDKEGILINYKEGSGHDSWAMPAGVMISFESQGDNGAYAAFGNNYIATVGHNGCQNPTYTGRYIGDSNSIHYFGVEYRSQITFCLQPGDVVFDKDYTFDHKVTRLNKLMTDITPAELYPNPGDHYDYSDMTGTLFYRSGAGTSSLRDLDGTSTPLAGGYAYITGGVMTMTGNTTNMEWQMFSSGCSLDASAKGISEATPLPYAAGGGDSGSPVYLWDAESQSYRYFAATQSASGIGSQARGNLKYDWEALTKFDAVVDMDAAADNTVHIKGVVAREGDVMISDNLTSPHVTYLHKGMVTADGSGEKLTDYIGVRGDYNTRIDTWLNAAALKDKDTWFAADSPYYNVGGSHEMGIEDLFNDSNLVFRTAQGTGNIVMVDEDTDLGVGYLQFSRKESLGEAEYTVMSNGTTAGGKGSAQRDFLLNSAGFVVDKDVAVHVKLTNTEWDADTGDYFYREWRKVGEGDLYLEGTGNNEIFLNVGGSGKTILNEKDGYAAYNVYAASGATVVLHDTEQIHRDFTFGYTGATLDFNGSGSMDWRFNAAADAPGFTIHSQSEDAYLTNGKAGSLFTLTYKEGGKQEFLGSFVDSAKGGAMKVVFDGGTDSELALHSVHTDLSHQAGSGLEVKSGSVSLSGTNTLHGTGSLDGHNAARYFSEDDWHYAYSKADVAVTGGTFTLGSHALLEGNVSIAAGGTFIMQEGVHHAQEYVEGGERLTDVTDSFYSNYYGVKGDINNKGTLKVAYTAGTDTNTTYGGKLSGNGAVVFDMGTDGGTLTLTNAGNDFSGTKQILSGGLIATQMGALGDVSLNKYVIGEKGYLAVENTAWTNETLAATVDSGSAGVLALTQSQTAELTSVPGLTIGALKGHDVTYGAAGSQLTALNGEWHLGGGGGNLIVASALRDGTLVVGNSSATGTLTLTNTNNSINTIRMEGAVTLNYAEGALGGATVQVGYPSRIADGEGLASRVHEDSEGVRLMSGTELGTVDMTAFGKMAMGVEGEATLSGMKVKAGDAYRLGGITGTLNVAANALAAGHDVVVDNHTYSGGTVVLNGTQGLNGAVTVTGYDETKVSGTAEGDITLVLGGKDTLSAATSLTVKNGGVVDVNGNDQSFNNLTVGQGGMVTDRAADSAAAISLSGNASVAGTVEVHQLAMANAAALNIADSGKVVLRDKQEGNTALNLTQIENHGTLSLELTGDGKNIVNLNSASNGRVELRSGALSYLSNLGTGSTLVLDAGTTFMFGNNNGSNDDAVFNNDIELAGDATLQVYGTVHHKSATIKGNVSGDYTLTKNDGNQKTTFSGTVDLAGFRKADGGGIVTFNKGANLGSLSMTDGTVQIYGASTIGTLSGAGSFALGGGRTLTVGSDEDSTYSGAMTMGYLTKVGSGQLNLDGTLTGLLITVNEGTLGLNGAAKSSLYELTLNGGCLQITGGMLDISNAAKKASYGGFNVNAPSAIKMTEEDILTCNYERYEDGSLSGNGYAAGYAKILQGPDNLTEATLANLHGEGALAGRTFKVEDHAIWVESSATNKHYFINTTVDYGKNGTGTAYTEADALVLNKEGAVLNMQDDLNRWVCTEGIVANRDATINIESGVTLTSDVLQDKANVTINGEGTYRLLAKESGDNGLGVNNHVSVGSDWTGTVDVVNPGGSNAHLLLQNYGNSRSSVRLNGVSGWLDNGAQIATNLEMTTAAGTSSLILANGNTGSTYTFAGDISGTGDLERKWSPGRSDAMNINFTGDLGGWTGNFVSAVSRDDTTTNVNLTKAGDMAVGAGFIRKTSLVEERDENDNKVNVLRSGILNVNVGDGSTATNATINGTLEDVSALSVRNQSAATLAGTDNTVAAISVESGAALTNSGSTTADKVTVAANATLANSGKLTVTTLANSGSVSNSGRLDLGETTAVGTLSNTAGGTVLVNALLTGGAITNNGDIVLSSAYTGDVSGYVDTQSQTSANGNGFVRTAVQLYTGGATYTGDGRVLYCGEDITAQVKDGGKSQTVTNYTTYYAKSGTETYSSILTASHDSLETINLKSGAALTVDSPAGATLHSAQLAAESGSSLSFNNTTMVVDAGTAATLTGSVVNLQVAAETPDTVYTMGSVSASTLHVSGTGGMDFTKGSLSVSNLNVESGSVKANNLKASTAVRVGNGGKLVLTQNDSLNNISSLVIGGSGTEDAVVELNGNPMLNSDKISLTGHGVFRNSGTLNMTSSSTISASGTDNLVDAGVKRWNGDLRLDVAEDGELLFSGSIADGGGWAVIKSGEGTLVLGRRNSASCTQRYDADFRVTAGDVKLDANVTFANFTESSGTAVDVAANRRVTMNGVTSLNDYGITVDRKAALHLGNKLSIEAADADHKARIAGDNTAYNAASLGYTITDAVLRSHTAAEGMTLSNKLQNVRIVNDGSGLLTENNSTNTGLDTELSAEAITGDISFLNKGTLGLELQDIVLGDNRALSVYEAAQMEEAQETKLAVAGVLTVGKNATVNANMTLMQGARLDVSASGNTGLALGSTLTLEQGLTLAPADIAAADRLHGNPYYLFSGVDAITLSGSAFIDTDTAITAADGIDAHTYFANVGEGQYRLVYTGAADGGKVYLASEIVPEPATATLSLLALAALAVRRRRR